MPFIQQTARKYLRCHCKVLSSCLLLSKLHTFMQEISNSLLGGGQGQHYARGVTSSSPGHTGRCSQTAAVSSACVGRLVSDSFCVSGAPKRYSLPMLTPSGLAVGA